MVKFAKSFGARNYSDCVTLGSRLYGRNSTYILICERERERDEVPRTPLRVTIHDPLLRCVRGMEER